MARVLAGETGPVHREPIFWEHEGNAGVRSGKWKLVREYKKPWELYDLQRDRTEMNNLAVREAGRRDGLVKLWTAWAEKNHVAFPERFNMYEFLRKKRGGK